MTPFFSVVIPLYNKEGFIKNTIKSALEQEYSNFELLIINDGSTDNSLTIAESFDHPKIKIYSQKNSGVSTARNNGVKFANGNYIAFLDADDYWFPNHLTELNKAITAYPDHKVFCNNYRVETKPNVFKQNSFSYLPEPDSKGLYVIENYFRSSLICDIAWTSAICIEKNLMLDGNLFDPTIISIQDIDLWTRLAINNPFIFNNKETTSYALYVYDSLSDSKDIDNRAFFISKNERFESQKPYLKSYLDQNRYSLAVKYKLLGEFKKSTALKSKIDLKNLSAKRKILLNFPQWLLKILLNFR